MLRLAVRREVLAGNPIDHVSCLLREPHISDAATATEVDVIRAAIAHWESGADHVSGPLPDGHLGAIVKMMRAPRTGSPRCSPSAAVTSTS